MRDERAADVLRRTLVECFRLAEAHNGDAGDSEIGRTDNRDDFAALTAETRRGGERPRNRPAAGLVELAGGGGQRAFFPDPDRDGA